MSNVTTTVRELRAGDSVRFPDGNGGQVWVSVHRVIADEPVVEILFGGSTDATYKTLPSSRVVVRAARPGEQDVAA